MTVHWMRMAVISASKSGVTPSSGEFESMRCC